nr:HAMP domain-containing histidine kinase [Bacteroidota bacterium]
MLEHEFDSMDDDDKLEIIQTLHKSSQNTYNQLVNLLDWSRSQRGLIKSKPKNINLFECTEAVIDLLRPKAKKKNHTLINNIQKDAFAFADENLTKHILINLINNAIKFTKPEGKIEVSAEKSINHHRVCVRDNGIGIPEHSFEQIFRINSDFNRQGTEMELGTGLGLVICKEFVALMNGTIEVQSRINQGSTFCFTLPSEASYIFSAQT